MNTAYVNVSFKQAKEIMDNSESFVILDVRTDEEFFTGHAEGAVNLDIDMLSEANAAEIISAKSTPVLVYCKTGERARLAAEALTEIGYTKVYNIGSLVEWPYGISYE